MCARNAAAGTQSSEFGVPGGGVFTRWYIKMGTAVRRGPWRSGAGFALVAVVWVATDVPVAACGVLVPQPARTAAVARHAHRIKTRPRARCGRASARAARCAADRRPAF